MIENEELGVKVATDKEEEFWFKIKEKCEETIKQCNHEITIQENIKELAEKKIKK